MDKVYKRRRRELAVNATKLMDNVDVLIAKVLEAKNKERVSKDRNNALNAIRVSKEAAAGGG